MLQNPERLTARYRWVNMSNICKGGLWIYHYLIICVFFFFYNSSVFKYNLNIYNKYGLQKDLKVLFSSWTDGVLQYVVWISMPGTVILCNSPRGKHPHPLCTIGQFLSRHPYLCGPQFDGPVKWGCDKQMRKVDGTHCHMAVNSRHWSLVTFKDFTNACFAAESKHTSFQWSLQSKDWLNITALTSVRTTIHVKWIKNWAVHI